MQVSDQIKIIVANQNNLNSKAYAEQWLENARTGEWDYAMAALQELAEFNNSSWLPWWSKSKRDPVNCRIELVDALHFMLSLAIAAYKNEDDAVTIIENAYVNSDLPSLDAEDKQIINWQEISVKSKFVTNELSAETVQIRPAFQTFFNLCYELNFSFKSLCALYMGKSTLNKFRQDKGYKQGLYRKNWPSKTEGVAPVEDNYYLAEFVTTSEVDLTVEDIRAWLETTYAGFFETTSVPSGSV